MILRSGCVEETPGASAPQAGPFQSVEMKAILDPLTGQSLALDNPAALVEALERFADVEQQIDTARRRIQTALVVWLDSQETVSVPLNVPAPLEEKHDG